MGGLCLCENFRTEKQRGFWGDSEQSGFSKLRLCASFPGLREPGLGELCLSDQVRELSKGVWGNCELSKRVWGNCARVTHFRTEPEGLGLKNLCKAGMTNFRHDGFPDFRGYAKGGFGGTVRMGPISGADPRGWGNCACMTGGRELGGGGLASCARRFRRMPACACRSCCASAPALVVLQTVFTGLVQAPPLSRT